MLTIHTAESADALLGPLAELILTPVPDVFAPEVLALPSQGVERWLSQSLSSRLGTGPAGADGICANIAFPSPAALVRDAVGEALRGATEPPPDDDPWEPSRLAWSILAVLDEHHEAAWCRTLARHLGYLAPAQGAVAPHDLDHRRSRRVSVAQRFARRFTTYAEQRPDLIRAWVSGADGGVGDDLAWQADLYRTVRGSLGVPGPVERLDAALPVLRADPTRVSLPERLSVFGATRLTTVQLQVLDALAAHREIHLWLPHPSHASWERVAASGAELGRRSDDTSGAVVRSPLLASFGRDSRELQLMIGAHLPTARLVHHASERTGESLLARLQRDLRADRPPAGDHVLAEGDRSFQVHACHGRSRQVEVMREVLLGLLDEQPELELRDVVVMCPDIEAFAPLVSAAFGLAAGAEGSAHPGHAFQVRLADRSLRQTNPVLMVLARVLDLADGRVTASEVLDLAAMEPVRRRFDFEDEDLEQIAGWVEDAAVRWGIDAQARAPFGLSGVAQNTWRAGLDRLLLGVAMDEDGLRTFAGVLPLDDVGSGDIEVVGRLAEFVDRLAGVLGGLSGARPLTDWVDALDEALELLTDVAHEDGWQVTQARQQLTRATRAAGVRGEEIPVRLPDVRAVLGDLLRGRPTRSGFRTGHLTLCSMVPMRAVPHPVVIMLGLDEASFPRQVERDGDDVLAAEPRVGEHDPRSEDRQLLLDALLAAGTTFVALYSGHDERTGAPRPASVPLAELVDAVEATLEPAPVPTRDAPDRLVVHHPLQPFDPRNFLPGDLVGTSAFSFDPVGFAGSRAMLGERTPQRRVVDEPLAPASLSGVSLIDLGRLLVAPAKAFLLQRLLVTSPGEHRDPEDLLRTEVRGLEAWQIGDRLLRAALRDEDFDTVVTAERARGTLPPGPLGDLALGGLLDDVAALVRWSRGPRSGPPTRIDVDARVLDDLRVHGVVQGVHDQRVVRVEYSRLKPKHRLESWLNLLALTVARPEVPWSTVVAGRGEEDGQVAYAYVEPVDPEVARATLDDLVRLYREGLASPLPMAEATSASYALQRSVGIDPDAALRTARNQHWAGRYGDGSDASVRLLWGSGDLDVMLQEPAPPESEEPTAFGHIARRVWGPLLAHEQRRTT